MVRKARSNVVLFRRLLLVALVFTVLAVAGLFLFGKAGLNRNRRPQEEEQARGGKNLTLIGEDFDYTFTERERPVFRIRGESVKADKEGILYLDGVGLTLYDEQGRIFHVESRKASFNRETNEGALQGKVILKGPDGLELRTARLDLKQKGERVLSRGPAEIRYGGKYVARSGKLQIDLPTEEYLLEGGARIESLPGAETPVLMTSQRMRYERKQRWIRIEGGANLRRGEDWISARRIFGNLNDDESGLKFVHAFWDVRGETRAAAPEGGTPTPTRVRFNGQDLAVVFQPEGNQARRVQLEGKGDSRVTLESVAPGVTRTLTARRIEGILAQGVLSGAEAFGGVDIRENSRVDGKPGASIVRHASGQRAVAEFRPDGQIAGANLNMNVVYRDPQVTASGNRVALEMDENRGEFFGSPVTITTDRGKVESPRVVYNTDQQIVHARAGVKAVLQKVEETALAGTPLSEGEGPVHVEAQEAFWRQEPSSFLFRGDVRAWRGENLLLAPELRGDKAADQLTATGGVKTLWFPTRKQANGTKSSAGTGQRPSLVQVVANEMSYQDQKGILVYTGNVRVDQEGKTLTCQRLDVEMDEEHQAETMTCTGDAKVNDPKVGRRIEGQRAVYHVGRRQVDVFGDPVVMSDKDGNQVRGKRALYSIDDGKVEVKGKDEAAPATAPAPPQTTEQQEPQGSGG